MALDLEAIYLRYHRMVVWLVRSQVPEPAVDDVVQDVFVAVHRRQARAPDGDELGRWVMGVTRSVCHGHRRSDARRRARLPRVSAPPPECEPETWLDERAALQRVARCLQSIEPRQREAFALIELHGLTAPEAAELLGANLDTVYSRLRLARRKLAQAMASPREVVASARRAGRPSTRETRGTWALIATRVGLGSGPVVASAATGHGWVGVLAGAGLAGLLVVGVVGSRSTATPSPGDTAARPEPPRPPVGLEPQAPHAPDRSALPPPETPTTSRSPPRRAPRPIGRPPRPQAEPPHRSSPAGTPAGTIGAETLILRDAARHLDSGDLDAASERLADHARRFTDGALRSEREQLATRLARLRRSTVTDAGSSGAP
ncbi:MAG: sigma-70 family RNA polymerase sigma factor [Myxococcales bacterium]|nr:sigma-70 family RNA polymerase sigma factor [Myxococcales bacterium]